MYYFIYHIISIGLYWEEASIEWNYRFHSLLKKNSQSAIRLKMKKCAKFTKFSVFDFFLTERVNISTYMAKNSLLGKSFSCRSSFSAAKTYDYPGQFQFFFLYLVLLPPLGNFERLCKKYEFFCALSSHNPRKSRQAILNWERSTLCHPFINLTQLIGDIKHM